MTAAPRLAPMGLTPADLLAPGAYRARREAWRRRTAQLRAERRVRIGPVTLAFENRETILFHVHEVLHVENAWSPERARRELLTYAELDPGPRALSATLFIDRGTPALATALARRLDGGAGVRLRVGRHAFAPRLLDPAELPASPVRYLGFDLTGLRGRLTEAPVALALTLDEVVLQQPLAATTARALQQDLDEARVR